MTKIIDFQKARVKAQIKKAKNSSTSTEWAVLGPLVEAQINPEGLAEKMLPLFQLDHLQGTDK